MFKHTKILVYLLSLFLISCASYNPGSYATIEGGEHPKLTPINAEITSQLSFEPFTYVNFSFGNKNDDSWTRIKRIKVTNISDIPEARLMVGPDLTFWAEGIQRKQSIDAHNRNMAYGAVMGALAVGAGISSAKGNRNLTVGLASGALLTGTIADVNNLIDKIDSLEISELVPPTHLYSPFSIPPGLFLSRWAVFQLPKGKKLNFLEFEVTYLSGKKARYKVNLTGKSNRRKS